MMRTLFFGTPDFAVPTLAAMVEAGYAPLRVITQPSRPVGRGRRLTDPPVARWAHEHGLEVRQPATVKDEAFLGELAGLAPDVAVVVAFGQIFRRRLLELPRHGCVNVHASLLPRYRGAAPIQAAIAAGDRVTGVSTMRMERGLDTGPVLAQAELEIGPEETSGELSPRLAELGAQLLGKTLRRLEAGELVPRPQDGTLASVAPRLAKSDGVVDWQAGAVEIWNRLRAYTPWPGLASELRGKVVKILWGRPGGPAPATAAAGAIADRRGGEVRVACGDGTMFVLERVQLPGKKPISAADFANGARLEIGERFAPP